VPVKEVSVRPNDVRILNVRVNEPEDRLLNMEKLPGITNVHDEVKR
jgi:hypothetical protein